MAQRSLEERLLLAQQQAEAQQERVRKLKAALRQRQRKEDTRRKILLGAVLSARMARDPQLNATVEQWLREDLDRPADRMLFALDPETEPQH